MPDIGRQANFDQSKSDLFASKMLDTINHASLCLMISIGHRTGLLDLMSQIPPATSDEISQAANMNERYVREWLAALVTGGVVEINPATATYFLPPEHAAYLTRAAAADNMAMMAQIFPMLGEVEEDILECFKKGGGVPYEKYPRFHTVMAEDQTVVSSLETRILPLVPGLTSRLQKGIQVLDVGCGSGRTLNRMAELYPNSRFHGIDLSEEAVQASRTAAAKKNLKNIEFIAQDLSDFDKTSDIQRFNFITSFDAIHDQSQPLRVLKGIFRALKDDGVYLMQDVNGTSDVYKDISHPLGTFLYAVSCMHCMTVSLAQGGEGVGAMWGEAKTREYLQRAGFHSIETHHLPHDITNNWYVIHK
jgi:2-polyprenyl-3-methyl-5-hydroxy-6-metoxy-1,4-benzoquinol methylase